MNHKRVYRLYSRAEQAVRKRKQAQRPVSGRVPLLAAPRVNEVSRKDYLSDSMANSRRFKRLTVADDFSRECVDIAVDYGISGQYVTWLLNQTALLRGSRPPCIPT